MVEVELGAALALTAASIFGLNDAIVRRITHRVETSTIVLYSLIIGSPSLLLSTIILEGLNHSLSLNAVLGYVLVGIGHFVVGRTLMYYSIKRIGGGPAAVIASTNPVLTALIAIILMGEPSSLKLWAGVFLVFSGAALASSHYAEGSLKFKDPIGVGVAFCASLTFSLTTVAIRFLNVSSGSPVVGATISYFTALIAYSTLTIPLRGLKSIVKTAEKPLLILAGLLVTVAQLFRFISLNYAYASIVSPLISTFTFFALFFLKIIPGTREHVGMSQVLGAITAFTGVVTILV